MEEKVRLSDDLDLAVTNYLKTQNNSHDFQNIVQVGEIFYSLLMYIQLTRNSFDGLLSLNKISFQWQINNSDASCLLYSKVSILHSENYCHLS